MADTWADLRRAAGEPGPHALLLLAALVPASSFFGLVWAVVAANVPAWEIWTENAWADLLFIAGTMGTGSVVARFVLGGFGWGEPASRLRMLAAGALSFVATELVYILSMSAAGAGESFWALAIDLEALLHLDNWIVILQYGWAGLVFNAVFVPRAARRYGARHGLVASSAGR